MTEIWDPAKESITADSFLLSTFTIDEKLKKYQADPGSIKRWRRNIYILALCLLPFGIYAAIYFGDWRVLLIVMALPMSILSSYIYSIKKIETQLIKLMVARRNGWVYNPRNDSSRWKTLVERFPIIFKIGRKQHMTDQYWGSIDTEGKKTEFWSGTFVFTIDSGKNSYTYMQRTIAIRLPRKIESSFYMRPESWKPFFGKDIQTESNEFNRAFEIRTTDKNGEQSDVIKTLSPAVQQELLNLRKKYNNFSLMFKDDTVMFKFERDFLRGRYTDFFYNVALDPRDAEATHAQFKELMTITGDILKYLD